MYKYFVSNLVLDTFNVVVLILIYNHSQHTKIWFR